MALYSCSTKIWYQTFFSSSVLKCNVQFEKNFKKKKKKNIYKVEITQLKWETGLVGIKTLLIVLWKLVYQSCVSCTIMLKHQFLLYDGFLTAAQEGVISLALFFLHQCQCSGLVGCVCVCVLIKTFICWLSWHFFSYTWDSLFNTSYA